PARPPAWAPPPARPPAQPPLAHTRSSTWPAPQELLVPETTVAPRGHAGQDARRVLFPHRQLPVLTRQSSRSRTVTLACEIRAIQAPTEVARATAGRPAPAPTLARLQGRW